MNRHPHGTLASQGEAEPTTPHRRPPETSLKASLSQRSSHSTGVRARGRSRWPGLTLSNTDRLLPASSDINWESSEAPFPALL